MSLAFQYHNARILINRPCLCRVDQRIPNESNRSRGFNRSAAATCILGARETIALLPDEPDLIALFATSPWWCLLHYLVSAGVILMVEMSMRAEHNPQQAEELLNDSKKVVRWLRAMSKDNIAAERSWAVLTKLLFISAPKIGGDITDVARDLDESDLANTAASQRLDSNDRSDNRPYLASVGSAAMLGIETPLDEPSAAPLSPQFADPDSMGSMQDIFRGILDESFPFGAIPIHSPFDNLMSMPGSTDFDATASASMDAVFPTEAPEFVDDELMYAQENRHSSHDESHTRLQNQHEQQQQQQHDALGEADRFKERMQKRLSRGVSNITMPPPPPMFVKWSTANEYGMRPMGSSYDSGVEQARADVVAATESVMSNNIQSPLLSPDKSRKRGGEQLPWPTI